MKWIIDDKYNDGYTAPEVHEEAVLLMQKLNPQPYVEHICNIKIDEDGMEDLQYTPEDTWAFKCTACEGEFRYDRGKAPNYCPKCGAKVVQE